MTTGSARGLRDRAEVRQHPALRRFVIVRNDRENRVGTGRLRRLRGRDRLAGGIRSGVGDDDRVAPDGLFDGSPQRDALARVERLTFAGRTGDDEPIVSALRRASAQGAAASRRSSSPRSSNGVTIAVRIAPSRDSWNRISFVEPELLVDRALRARDVVGRHEDRDRYVAVGAMDDLDVGARERVHDVMDDAGRVAHAGADDRELRAAFAHANGEIQISKQATNFASAIAFDDERDAGLIDRDLIDRNSRRRRRDETSRARSPFGASAIRCRRE